MANKQVRLSEQEHRLILLLRSSPLEVEQVTQFIVHAILGETSRPAEKPQEPSIIEMLHKHYTD